MFFFVIFFRSPFRTLPRGPTDPRLAGMYQAINPLKDYGYPSDYGLPMAFNGHHSITSNPLSEFDEELEIASYNTGSGNKQQQPQPQHHLVPKNNLSSSGSSTLSPPRGGGGCHQGGQLSSTSGIGDLSTASGKENKQSTIPRTKKKIWESTLQK